MDSDVAASCNIKVQIIVKIIGQILLFCFKIDVLLFHYIQIACYKQHKCGFSPLKPDKRNNVN